LIEIYNPTDAEQWKIIAREFNTTLPTNRAWHALRKHYTDAVRRSRLKRFSDSLSESSQQSGAVNLNGETDAVVNSESLLLDNINNCFANTNENKNTSVKTADNQFNNVNAHKVQAAQNIISIVNHNTIYQVTSLEEAKEHADASTTISSNRNNCSISGSKCIRALPTTTTTSVPATMPVSIIQISRGNNIRQAPDYPAATRTGSNKRARLNEELTNSGSNQLHNSDAPPLTSSVNNAPLSSNNSIDALRQVVYNYHLQYQQFNSCLLDALNLRSGNKTSILGRKN
jgi:hypothetical protein